MGAAEEKASPEARPTSSRSPGRTHAAAVALAGSYLGAGLTIVKGLVLVPLYLHFLGVAIYGAWLASGSVVGLLGLFEVGVGSVLAQNLAETWGRGDKVRFARLAAAGAAVVAAIAASMALAGFAVAPFVPHWINAPSESGRAIAGAFLLASIGAAEAVALGNLLAVSTAWQQSKVGAVARITGQIVEMAVILVGLYRGLGVWALGLGAVGGGSGSLLVAAAWTGRGWSAQGLPWSTPRGEDLGRLLVTTLPLTVSRILLQIDANIEVALVAAFVNPTAAAVYSITDRVLKLVMGFINSVGYAAAGGLAHFFGELGRKAVAGPTRELLGLWSVIVAIALPALLALNQDFTAVWVGPANFGGFALNAAFVGSELLGSRELLMAMALVAVGAISASGWLSAAEVAVRLPLMYLALRWWGSIGLPVATALVSLLALVVYGGMVGRRLELPGRRRLDLGLAGWLPVGLSFAVALLEARWLPHATGWGGLVVKGAAVGVVHLSLGLGLNAEGRSVAFRRLSQLLSRPASA